VVRRHELTGQEWELLAPLIPRAATGRPRVEDRQVVNGMVYKIRPGVSWRDLPERYGPWQTVYTRFRRYSRNPRRWVRPKKRSSNWVAYSSNGPGAGGHGRRAVIFSPQQGS
jgi:transposase